MGFSDLDFKKLFDNGEIEIITKNNSLKTLSIKKTITKTLTSSKLDKTKKIATASCWQNTQYLVLGTMPCEQSLIAQEYYNNSKNKFWEIISIASNNGNGFLNYTEKLKILKQNRIGLWDVLDACEREGSLDSKIKNTP